MKQTYNLTQIVGNNLRNLRKKRNLSQLEMSAKTNLSHTFINNIENGKKWVSHKTLAIFCRELNAYPFEFFLTDDIPDLNTRYKTETEHNHLILELAEILSRYKTDNQN